MKDNDLDITSSVQQIVYFGLCPMEIVGDLHFPCLLDRQFHFSNCFYFYDSHPLFFGLVKNFQ